MVVQCSSRGVVHVWFHRFAPEQVRAGAPFEATKKVFVSEKSLPQRASPTSAVGAGSFFVAVSAEVRLGESVTATGATTEQP